MADESTHESERDELGGNLPAVDFPELAQFAEFANVYKRELTDAEFEHLLALFPFIELYDPSARVKDMTAPKPKKTARGWDILDMKTRMLAGPGASRFGRRKEEGDDDDGGGGLLMNGILAVEEMMLDAMMRWQDIGVGEGHHPLRRMAWMVGQDNGIDVVGFYPTFDDQMAYNSVKLARTKPLSEIISTPTLKQN
jgi:hypothetical protein